MRLSSRPGQCPTRQRSERARCTARAACNVDRCRVHRTACAMPTWRPPSLVGQSCSEKSGLTRPAFAVASWSNSGTSGDGCSGSMYPRATADAARNRTRTTAARNERGAEALGPLRGYSGYSHGCYSHGYSEYSCLIAPTRNGGTGPPVAGRSAGTRGRGCLAPRPAATWQRARLQHPLCNSARCNGQQASCNGRRAAGQRATWSMHASCSRRGAAMRQAAVGIRGQSFAARVRLSRKSIRQFGVA